MTEAQHTNGAAFSLHVTKVPVATVRLYALLLLRYSLIRSDLVQNAVIFWHAQETRVSVAKLKSHSLKIVAATFIDAHGTKNEYVRHGPLVSDWKYFGVDVCSFGSLVGYFILNKNQFNECNFYA